MPAGVQFVRDEIAATGLFERDQRFPLELRPGATPPGRGVGSLLFKAWRDTRTVDVQTAMDQGPDESYFQPSRARTQLDRLSKQLLKPETWLPANAWADSTPRAYEAATFALLLRTEVGQSNERPTIDSLSAAWPFSIGPLDLGQTLPATAGPDVTRCTVLTHEDMVAVANAILRASDPDPVFALPKPEAYHDILDAIGKHAIIDKQLAYRLEHLANLRNLLAYDREQTDIDEVYASVQTRVADLLAFADQIERFIGADAAA